MSITALLLGGDCFWLPRWLLDRKISRERFEKALSFLRRPAGCGGSVCHLRRPGSPDAVGLGLIGHDGLLAGTALVFLMSVVAFVVTRFV